MLLVYWGKFDAFVTGIVCVAYSALSTKNNRLNAVKGEENSQSKQPTSLWVIHPLSLASSLGGEQSFVRSCMSSMSNCLVRAVWSVNTRQLGSFYQVSLRFIGSTVLKRCKTCLILTRKTCLTFLMWSLLFFTKITLLVSTITAEESCWSYVMQR